MSVTERLVPLVFRTLLSGLAATWRFEVVEGGAQVAQLQARTPGLVGFWHEQLPASALWVTRTLVSEERRVTTIVSRSKDGEIAARLVAPLGVDVVRGSSSRGGAPGLRGLLRALRANQLVALTPDGPRGPARVAKPGILALAQMARQPIVPLAVRGMSCWRLRSWDRMEIPKPFSRVRVGLGEPLLVEPDANLEDAARHFGEALDALSARLVPTSPPGTSG